MVFSAGSDATSTNITLSGAVVANSITVEELLNITATASTPSLTLGAGGVTINSTVGANTTTWINTLPTLCQCCAQGKDERRAEKARRCCARGLCCHDVPGSRTISDIRACLRSALSHAVRAELVTRNVAQFVTLPSVRKKKRKAWTTDEVRIFLESARSARDAMFAAYVLAVILGLRKGEILGLTWSDLDLDGGELTVGRQLQRASGELLHRETKTEASDDTLPLPDVVITALRQRQEVQRADRAKAGRAWQDTVGLVFTTKTGLPIEPRNFNRSWDNRCARAKIRKITIHDARRSCATLLVDLDIHPRVIMRILRHAQFSVTMEIYSQASSAATKAALHKLGDSLGG